MRLYNVTQLHERITALEAERDHALQQASRLWDERDDARDRIRYLEALLTVSLCNTCEKAVL